MKARSRISAVWVTLLALNFIPAVGTRQDSGLRVRISIYEVPFDIVSRIISSQVNSDGSIEGTMVSGVTTAKFPKSSVLLQNCLSGNPLTSTIKETIREYMAYGCVRSQDITVSGLAEQEFAFDDNLPQAQEISRDVESYPYDISFHLRIEPAWKTAEDIGVAVKLWLDWKDAPGVEPFGMPGRDQPVMDQTIPVRICQTSLAGFRSTADGHRRAVYWLAVSAEKR